MPCKIQIKQNITQYVEEKTNRGFNKSLDVAQEIARKVNAEFGVKVVGFTRSNSDYIDRNINIPISLIDRYYNHERKLEANAFVSYNLKATDILKSDRAKDIFTKGVRNNWSLDKILTELQIPVQQKDIILNKNLNKREDIITSLLAENSFVIEINTSRKSINDPIWNIKDPVFINNQQMADMVGGNIGQFVVLYSNVETEEPSYKIFDTKEEAKNFNWHQGKPTNKYQDIGVPGGINYKEKAIQTPGILNKSTAHINDFSQRIQNLLGWFRSDEVKQGPIGSDTLRILEIQSAIFQKGRQMEDLTKTKDPRQNQFLQLLNKKNKWVRFFIESIIQDSNRKGYKKIMFPTGRTAAIIQGHPTIEEELKNNNKIIEGLKYAEVFGSGNKFYWAITKKGFEATSRYMSSREAVLKDINRRRQEAKRKKEELKVEGIEKLAPIEDFYSNKVTNILNKLYNVKQITDEYGNTWNEISLAESKIKQSISLQTSNMDMTEADGATIERVKMVAEKMGVKLQPLADYLKGNPDIQDTGINAVADTFRNVIAIASGREAGAITEEMVHVATSILEQTNPELITNLIKEIGKYKIYKRVFDAYKDKKAYQLSNGKPNIRKIKKEAVDKLIAEVIVQESPNVDGNPELLQPTIIERIKNFWRSILNAIGKNYRMTNLDMFETAASLIMDGVGSVDNIKNKDIYYQSGGNAVVDQIYQTIQDKGKDMILHPETADKKRHYTKAGEEIKVSVTEMLQKEKEKSGKAISERSEKEKAVDKIKADWGHAAHKFIEDYIKANLIDSDGYALNTIKNNTVTTELDAESQKIVSSYIKELISSYNPGTRFIIETFAINEAVSGGMASTIDFLAIEPVENEEGQPDAKVDILDWKFSGYDPERNAGDIPFYKQTDWKAQMNEYSRMLRNYGIKASQIRKSRMIPFKMTYTPHNEKQPELGMDIKSIEIGNLNNLKESKVYLLPVATDSESTGYAKIDKLIKGLRIQYARLYSKFVTEGEQAGKIAELAQISRAIRTLHMQHDFKPFLAVATTFSKRFDVLLKQMDKVNFNELSDEELLGKLEELATMKASAEKYLDLSATFEMIADKDNKIHTIISQKLSSFDDDIQKQMVLATRVQGEYAMQEAINRNLISEEHRREVLGSERAIDKISKGFLESSKLPAYLIKLGTNMVMRVKDLVDLQYSKKMNEFKKILIPLEKLARSKGVKAFDLIAYKTKDGMSLIKKLDKEFVNKVNKAKGEKDLAFLKDALDMKEYEKNLAETIKQNIERIENRTWFPLDATADRNKKDYEIRRLKQRVDINNKKFNGFESTHFSWLFYNSIQEEKFYSPKFKELKASPESYAAWQFFTELNKTAKQLGYLERNTLSFFPLIEATTIEKIAQSKNPFFQAWDSIKDTVSMRINEKKAYGKIDEETGELKRVIPKYFTATDKQVEQLSTNLDMIGSMWIKSILDYKASRELEYRLLTLYDVEKAKQNLAVSADGQLVYEGDELQTTTGENKNAQVMRTMIDDAVYGMKEDLDSWGAQTISSYANLRGGTADSKEKRALNVKKTMKSADVLFRALAIGLKPAIGLANYFGLQMQAFINAGEFYRFREFTKNNTLVKANAFSREQKALLHLIMPLNEDLIAEKRREISRKKGSVGKWLSTWTFTDVMMSTNSFPERLLQIANAVSMNDNAMVVDGKIVNIRQHLKEQDRKVKYNMTAEKRKALEKTFNARVQELKDTKSLSKIVKIDGDNISIPGVELQTIADYRTMTREYGRKLSGLMNENNKMGYRRDTILSSFMMFKSWMPKHLGTRILDINKNIELNQWEYGKSRLFFKVALSLGVRNMTKMRDIITGNEAGLEFMQKMLQEKKAAYFEKTGKVLDISEEEFYDLVRTELHNATKELLMVVNMTALYFTMAAAEPPEDVDPATLNAWKYMALTFTKTSDEIMFYYSPIAFTEMSSGAILPSLGLITKTMKAFSELGQQINGYYLDDEDIMNGADPTKYFLNLVPGAAQFQNVLLPMIFPEMAKDLGIRVSANPFHR